MVLSRYRSVPTKTGILLALLAATLPAQGGLRGGPSVSPFRGLRLIEGGLEAQVHDATWHRLVAIDDVKTGDLLEQSKQICGDRWWKRITEDLPALMDAMGHPMEATATLTVIDPTTGAERVLENVPMSHENRQRLRAQYRGRAPEPGVATQAFGIAEVHADLAELRALLDGEFAYRHLRDVDVDGWVREAFARLSEGKVSRAALAAEIDALMQRFGDGHSGVSSHELRQEGAWSSFLVQKVQGGYAAFHDRRELLDPAFPYVVAIQGVPLERWLDESRKLASRGSDAMIARDTERGLRAIDALRRALGLPLDERFEVTLASADGATRTRRTEVEGRKPLYGAWPRTAPAGLRLDGTLPGNIGYLRIAEMTDDEGFLRSIDETMARLRDTEALIVDVRGNGGGTRDVLRRLFPYFLAEDEGPQVVNAARRIVRNSERDRMDLLDDRFMVRVDDPSLGDAQKKAIAAFLEGFEPQWIPPSDRENFSALHVLLIDRKTNPRAYPYSKPVRILMDGGCFSATDIFLAAMKTRPQVELIGTPSGGGSGRAVTHRLTHSGIELRLSSMVSYQPDGRLFEGHGVTPHRVLEPIATDLVADGTDSVLDAAK